MRTRILHRRTPLALGFTSLSLLLQLTAVAHAQPAQAADPAAPAGPSAAPATSAAPTVAPEPTAAPTPSPDGVEPAAPSASPATPTAAAPAPVAAPTAADDAAADAEASVLEKELVEKATGDDGLKLDVYGFADFTYGLAVKKFAFGPPHNSFAVGNLNLYLASNLGDKWRSLAEVRFSYLPHGVNQVDETGQIKRIDTTVADYTDLGRTKRWGGIMIERAYLEYLAHPMLNIRAGHFLTPYGIWNVDHGSPVIIGVRRPFIVGEAMIPESQTGLELYGTYHLDPVQLGYHLTLSNGRGPIDTYQDLNGNKAIGGRLFAHADTPAGAVTLGLSGYSGRYTDASQQYGIDANGDFTVSYPVTLDYNELSLGADLKWEYGGLLVQSEAMMNDVVYDQMRPPAVVFAGPPGFLADYRRLGAYGLAGYRFDWGGIMPFAGLEYYNNPGSNGSIGKSAAFWGGLNVRPTARVVLKAQYTYSWFPDDPVGIAPDTHFNSIDFQAAWSF